MAATAPAFQKDLMEKLDRALERFGAERVNDITDRYSYVPSMAQARLGEGSYGAAYRMQAKGSADGNGINGASATTAALATRVVKVIPKERVTRHLLQIQHLCAELAVTKLLQHENLNRRVGLLHNQTTVFVVLELVEGRKPDLATRLYCLFAKHGPKGRLAEVADMVRDCPEGGEDQLVAAELRQLGLTKEDPLANDLFATIVHYKKLPAKKALIILKQILEGLQFLHQNQVVHRDMKTENLVLGEDRKATPIWGDPVADGKRELLGVRIEERVRCRIIDFGLAKYLTHYQQPTSPSPGCYDRATAVASHDGMFASAAPMESMAGATTTTAQTFAQIPVTPCGTELYCSLEVIQGIIGGGYGRSKWTSTKETLPKFDVYGAGTMMYCMCNGRPPFRFTSYRQVAREEKLRQMSNMIAAGPQFAPGCPEFVRPLIRLLMSNSVQHRPHAAEALQDPLFAGVGRTYVYEVMLDGTVNELDDVVEEDAAAPSSRQASEKTVAEEQAKSEGTSEVEAGNAEEDAEEGGDALSLVACDVEEMRAVMSVVRGLEDDGDGAGKEDADRQGEAAAAAAAAASSQ